MTKRLLPAALAALLVPASVLAQDVKGVVRTPAEARLVYPLLTQQLRVKPQPQSVPNASRLLRQAPQPKADPLKAEKAAKFWCNVIYKAGWTDTNMGPYGYYTLTTSSPVSFDLLANTGETVYVASNGVQAKDGHLYGAYLNMQYASEGYVFFYLADTDTKTGQTSISDIGMDYLYLAATETAQAADGTVYGVFYSADGQSLEWGSVDYATRQRSTIGAAKQAYVALGITKMGQLYGVAMDGNLYKVNKSTGEETLVGPTGLQLTNAMGQYYGQSGEIDQSDDTFYWYAIDSQVNGGLYTVDLKTGKATLVDGTLAQINGMVLAQPEAQDGAPERADNVALDQIQVGSQSGATATLSFTIPNTTYDGEILRGDVQYRITSDRPTATITPASGTAQPGQDVSVQVKATENEQYTFTVTLSNDKGESPAESTSAWMGYDYPLAPSSVQATADGYKANVSWTAPRTTVHAGPMGDLTYDVLRISGQDTTTVAEGITDTQYTDNIGSGTLANYVYGIRAVSKGLKSALGYSHGIVIGDAIEPDWETDFSNYSSFDIFTTEDANRDGVTWTYFNAGGQHMALGPYNNDNGNDDWLFTPPLHLTPGRVYNVKMRARNYLAPDYINTFEVAYGREAASTAMTQVLMPTNEISGDPDQEYLLEIQPDEDGKYYVGFHDNTEQAGAGRTVVDYFKIEAGPLFAAPDSVTHLTATPAGQGQLSATLKFQGPEKAINGSTITRSGYVTIKRDGKAVMWIGNASTQYIEAGKEYTWTDEGVPAPGWHTYEVIPYTEDGYDPGRAATIKVYIGTDVTVAPAVTLTDKQNDITASWRKFGDIGANNGYVDPNKVEVSVYELLETIDGQQLGDLITTSQPGGTEVNIGWNPYETIADDAETQALMQVAARTHTDGGYSEFAASSAVVVGQPLTLPYIENFSEGNIENKFAWSESNAQHASRWNAAQWMINGKAASNDDGGGLLWSPYTIPDPEFPEYYNIEAGDQVSFNLPKVILGGVDEPVVRFDLYSENGEQTDIDVIAQTPDGNQHKLKTIKLSEKRTTGWETHEVDLTPYTDERYVIVKFRATAHANYAYVCIDQINIYDKTEADGINAAELLKQGKYDILTLDGRVVRRNATTTDGLAKGAYLINDRKVIIK